MASSTQMQPRELRALIELNPRTDPEHYWNGPRGWDIEGIRADLQIAMRSATPAKRDGTFGSLLSTVRAATGAGKADLGQRVGPGSAAKLAPPIATPDGMPASPFPSVPSAFAAPPPGRAVAGPHASQSPKGKGAGKGKSKWKEKTLPSLGTKVVPEKMRDKDNEGREFDLKQVVVNFANVGHSYGKMFHPDLASELRKGGKGKDKGKSKDKDDNENVVFHWEGVRRCVKYLVKKKKMKVTGVIYQNFSAPDNSSTEKWQRVKGVPKDIEELCESIQETPRVAGAHQKSADDEMTIKCAYHRNCRLLDNDNYKDWLHNLRDDEIREWYQNCQSRVHMKYYFDKAVGVFETLDGNAERGASEEREEAPPAEARTGVLRQSGKQQTREVIRTEAECVTPPEVTSSLSSFPGPLLLPTEGGYRRPLGPTITVSSGSKVASAEPLGDDLISTQVNTPKAGWTPLCVAVQQGNFETVKTLLARGASPNIPNAHGAHPLFYALSGWSLRLFRLLKKHGADPAIARSERGEHLKAYATRKVTQAGRQGAPAFAAASRQELLNEVGAESLARRVAAIVEEARRKRQRTAAAVEAGPAASGTSPPPAKRRETGEQLRQRMQQLHSRVEPHTKGKSPKPTVADPYGGRSPGKRKAVVSPGSAIDLTELDTEALPEGTDSSLQPLEAAAYGAEAALAEEDSDDFQDEEVSAMLRASTADAPSPSTEAPPTLTGEDPYL